MKPSKTLRSLSLSQRFFGAALVTGASSGIGACFCKTLAALEMDLIMVARRKAQLETLAQELSQKHKITCLAVSQDLTETDALLAFTKQVNEAYDVFMLINNAGIGGTNKFDLTATKNIIDIIQLNILALSVLTHKLLPNLLKQPRGYVLNVSSIAACSPIGFKTVYPASKAFVYSFSLGLNEELKNTSVSVSVVNPGPMATNSEGSNRLNKHGLIARMIKLEPSKVANYCITYLLKGDRVIKVNFWSWSILRNIPVWIKLPVLTNAVRKEIAQ